MTVEWVTSGSNKSTPISNHSFLDKTTWTLDKGSSC